MSPEVRSIVRRPPFDATLDMTPIRPVAGEPAVAEVEVTNDLGRPIEDVVLTVDVPGVDVLSVRPRRCTAEDVVRCSAGTLAPGEQASVRVRLRPFDQGRLRPVVTARGEGVARQRFTLGPVRVRPGAARLSVRKSADVDIARSGRLVTCRIVVTAGRRAAAARRTRVCDLPGSGLRLRSVSRGGVLHDGRASWRLGKLLPGRSRRVTAVARVTASSGLVRNAARARSANRRGRGPAVSVARVHVAPRSPQACPAVSRPRAHAAC